MAKDKKHELGKPKCDKTMLIARIFIVALFAMSLWGKLSGFAGNVAYAESVVTFVPGELTIIIGIIMEAVGVVLILSGWRMCIGALTLAAYTVLTIVFFHNPIMDAGQWTTALKNLSIVGGLMVLSMMNPGKYALKE